MNDILIVDPAGAALLRHGDGYKLYRWLDVQTGQDSGAYSIDRRHVDQLPKAVWTASPALTLTGRMAQISTAIGSWQLPIEATYQDQALPTMPDDGWQDGRPLTDVWAPLLPCMCADNTRPGICALEIGISEAGAHMAATDGYRLAYWSGSLPLPAEALHWPNAVLHWPAPALRWLATQRGNWEWQLHNGAILVRSGAWLLVTAPQPGFPDYRQYIADTPCSSTCTLPAKMLASALRTVQVGVAPRRCLLAWQDGVLRLTGSGHKNDAVAAGNVAAATDGSGTVLLDPDMLRGMLAPFGSASVTIQWSNEHAPLIMRAGAYRMLQQPCLAKR